MKLFNQLVLAVLAWSALASGVQAADAPIIREIYTCSFNDGKGMDDLLAARDFYLRQMEKAGQEPNDAFVWTPYKAPVDFDFLWANNSSDLETYGADADAFNGSAEGQAAMDRFNQVATCTSSIAARRQFIDPVGEFSGDSGSPAIINAAACNYQRGHGPDALDDMLSHLAAAMGSLEREDGFIAFASQPMYGAGPNTRDLYLYGVQGTMEDWAARMTALQASPEGPSLSRHFNTILDCSQALFFGQPVVPKPE